MTSPGSTMRNVLSLWPLMYADAERKWRTNAVPSSPWHSSRLKPCAAATQRARRAGGAGRQSGHRRHAAQRLPSRARGPWPRVATATAIHPPCRCSWQSAGRVDAALEPRSISPDGPRAAVRLPFGRMLDSRCMGRAQDELSESLGVVQLSARCDARHCVSARRRAQHVRSPAAAAG
jgi:hypothetical protein